MFQLNRNKQKTNRNRLFDRDHILVFYKEHLGFFLFFLVFFGLFRNSLFQLSCFYTETESFDVLIEPKQTENQPKQFEREHIWVFLRKFWVVSVCYEKVLFVSVVSI
jgi:hypothetical protein